MYQSKEMVFDSDAHSSPLDLDGTLVKLEAQGDQYNHQDNSGITTIHGLRQACTLRELQGNHLPTKWS